MKNKLELVNFEQAKALKELGFNCKTEYWYQKDSPKHNFELHSSHFYPYKKNKNDIAAPELELVAKWLLMEYGFLFLISPNNGWVCQVHEYDEPFKNYRFPWENENIRNIFKISNEFNSYGDALSAGIDKAIEILKEK